MFQKKDKYLSSTIKIDERKKAKLIRERLFGKKYLGEIIEEEGTEFGSNNLILAPVGSGKSFLIEKLLIPEGFNKKIIYLTSNSALKDSICPNNNKLREKLALEGTSVNFFTTENKKSFGDSQYSVHVMTYHEFGLRIEAPYQRFTDDVGLIFCDEIHSLPIFRSYGTSGELSIALRWLFTEHEGIDIYYFTATEDSITKLEERSPGYLEKVDIFNYLNHPKIRRYRTNSVYYVSHIEEVRVHLRARLDAVLNDGHKGIAFTRLISEQKKIEKIVEEEGYTPLVLWSINNEDKMSEEQLISRKYILETGMIPEPYNLLIINGAMQEGWNLYDEDVMFAIMDTLDNTERVQALGRIRKDTDFVVYKTEDEDLIASTIIVNSKYLNRSLTSKEKELMCEEIGLLDNKGRLVKWRKLKGLLEKTRYTVVDKTVRIDGKRVRVTEISL